MVMTVRTILVLLAVVLSACAPSGNTSSSSIPDKVFVTLFLNDWEVQTYETQPALALYGNVVPERYYFASEDQVIIRFRLDSAQGASSAHYELRLDNLVPYGPIQAWAKRASYPLDMSIAPVPRDILEIDMVMKDGVVKSNVIRNAGRQTNGMKLSHLERDPYGQKIIVIVSRFFPGVAWRGRAPTQRTGEFLIRAVAS